jgi:hypothetical protein
VKIVGRGNDYGVQIALLDHLAIVGEDLWNPVLDRQLLRAIAVPTTDRTDLGTGMAFETFQVQYLSEIACSNHAHPDFSVHRSSSVIRKLADQL